MIHIPCGKRSRLPFNAHGLPFHPMKTLTLCLGLLLVACSNSTEPKTRGLDPAVLITNHSNVPLYFTWRDGQGIVGADTIPSQVTRCEHFLAQADSAYFHAEATENAGTSLYTQPWFNPATRPAWSMLVTSQVGGGSPLILVADTTGAC